jgi:hypothetical protein
MAVEIWRLALCVLWTLQFAKFRFSNHFTRCVSRKGVAVCLCMLIRSSARQGADNSIEFFPQAGSIAPRFDPSPAARQP